MRGRSTEEEILDDPGISSNALQSSLNFMRRVNRRLGGHRTILEYFKQQALPESFSVLDIGCGGGDIPFELARWARARGKKVRITAIDLQPFCLESASRNFSDPAIAYREHSAFAIEELGGFDYIISSMFFHHLSDTDIVSLLKKMHAQASRGWIVNDLYRGRAHFLGAWFLGALSFQPIIWNDAKLSVARSFRENDLQRYREEAGVGGAVIARRPVFRITLSHAKRPD